MSPQPRRLLAPLLLVLVLTACGGGEPVSPSTSEPTQTAAPSPTPTATPTKSDAPVPPKDAAWEAERRVLGNGRAYWMGVPTCSPSRACKAWKQHPRKLMVWLHGRGQPEIPANAGYNLRVMLQSTDNDVVPVYAVTADGEADGFSWDAGFCCTTRTVDDLGYLDDVIRDAGKRAAVDPERVGLTGASNGGLLATKAICTQPEKFKAIAIWAASWKGRCDKAPVIIAHWHGEADTVIRPEGGPFTLGDRTVVFPPADWLESHLAPGSTFKLVMVPGASHFQMPAGRLQILFSWLDEQL